MDIKPKCFCGGPIEKVVDKLSASAPSRIRDISDVSAIEKDARMYAKEVLKKG